MHCATHVIYYSGFSSAWDFFTDEDDDILAEIAQEEMDRFLQELSDDEFLAAINMD